MSYGIIVDPEDTWLLSEYAWYPADNTHGGITVQAADNGTIIILARVIMNAPPDKQVDHKDRNGLNCSRSNMRLATAAQNQWNSTKTRSNTGYRGVSFRAKTGRYRAMIRVNGNRIELGGAFKTAEEAYAAYVAASIKYHGEFSPHYIGG